MPNRILVVEDERSVGAAVTYALEREGFEVALAADGNTAVDLLRDSPPDLVVLDLMLPGLSGWDVLSALRRQGSTPVIVLTARTEEADRVAGLEMGADDYVVKPFSMRELVARVRAVLRRAAGEPDEESGPVISLSGVELDLDRHEVTVEGQAVELSPKEFDLLAYLMKNAGRIRTREQILNAVWGDDSFIERRTVDVHMRWLRMKIEPDPAKPQRLLTVRGVGYKFVGER